MHGIITQPESIPSLIMLIILIAGLSTLLIDWLSECFCVDEWAD